MADNRGYVYRRLRHELGLTPAQAAGAVGGLGGESGKTLSTRARNPTSGAFGIGQWLAGRLQALEARGNPTSLKTQTDHLISELKGPERGALGALRGAHSIEDATHTFVKAFERPSPGEIASSMPARLRYARDAFNALGGTDGTSGASGLARASAASSGPITRTSKELVSPAVNNQAARAALVYQFLSPTKSGAPRDLLNFATGIKGLQDQPAVYSTKTTVTPGTTDSGGGASTSPGAGASSGAFAKGHSPLFELIHKGDRPYAVKDGRVVDKSVYAGVWDGHADHVHVAAGPNTIIGIGRLAQKMGLHVGENPHFGGVNPVHSPGSYHYRGEAIDVSGDPKAMNTFSRRVEHLYGLK